jgi:hypothetical protein
LTKAPPAVVLSPLADTVSQYLVFDPAVQTWFLASKRGKRLLIDIGRVDTDVRRDRHRAAAFREAVKALSPVPVGTPVRVYDALGAEDDTITGFDSWNGRIVATFKPGAPLDSLVRRSPGVYAAVERTDTLADSLHSDSTRRADSARAAATGAGPSPATTAAGPVHEGVRLPPGGPPAAAGPPPKDSSTLAQDSAAAATVCLRDTLPTPLAARALAVRDSLDLWLRTLPPPPFDRLVSTERTQSTQVVGCFGGANRVAIAVDLRAGANEWIRERAVLLDTLGRVTTLHVYDFRFKGHDLVAAIDPNGQGVDGVVARGVAEASGATVILALEPGNRLTRWVAGFAWESR